MGWRVILFSVLLVQGAFARDVGGAKAELGSSADSRVRVAAALYLGSVKGDDSVRASLEKALADSNAVVRTAAAVALSSRGDAASLPAMEKRAQVEPSAEVKSQLKLSADSLRMQASATGVHPTPSQKFVVQIGSMKNNSGIGGDKLGKIMKKAARDQAVKLSGAVVIESASLAKAASQEKIPLLVLDASLVSLSPSAGGSAYSANVDFSIRKGADNTLRASLNGKATSIASQTKTNTNVVAQQNQAVAGAVESALRNVSGSFAQLAN
ncbi:MAG: HEAT repeat domain-containing protein [Polyangiaceae bacterium]|nr:HEAT repeat domain-containing protein [Polyangiaceae bacterium]